MESVRGDAYCAGDKAHKAKLTKAQKKQEVVLELVDNLIHTLER